jgi:hypothetical protein
VDLETQTKNATPLSSIKQVTYEDRLKEYFEKVEMNSSKVLARYNTRVDEGRWSEKSRVSGYLSGNTSRLVSLSPKSMPKLKRGPSPESVYEREAKL